MARDSRSQSGSSGSLSYTPAPGEGPVPRTLEFIRTKLPAWRDDPTRPSDPSEKRLNSSLCDFLDSRARSDFPMVRFKHESPQTKSRTIDMAVHGTGEVTLIGAHGYTIYEPFLVIEAKRLPAPSKDREREYVTGTDKARRGVTGGIQRFKLGLHGANVESAVIIGYVERLSVHYWHATINQWIADLVGKASSDGCVWGKSDTLDRLICDDQQETSIAASNHQRSGTCLTSSIRIHHLWVVMNSENRGLPRPSSADS